MDNNMSMSSPSAPVPTGSPGHLPTVITTALITALVVGFGAYFLTKPAVVPTIPPIPSASVDATEWKTYTNTNQETQRYSIQYPATWSATAFFTRIAEPELYTHRLDLSRSNYKISVYQPPVGEGAVCVFSENFGNDAYEIDFRGSRYVEFVNFLGTLRRTERKDMTPQPGITTFAFCQKHQNSESFYLGTSVGYITYSMPTNYDTLILSEMDLIVKTIKEL